MPEPLYTARGATFSPCGLYRYLLEAVWDARLGLVLWVMLNPSTADATKLDPTLTRCLKFTQRWGFGGLLVANLFGLRSMDPQALRRAADPVGPENDAAILGAAARASFVVCGWGTFGVLRHREDDVRRLLHGYDLHALRVTRGGDPSHPLYLPGDLAPVLWRPRRAA